MKSITSYATTGYNLNNHFYGVMKTMNRGNNYGDS